MSDEAPARKAGYIHDVRPGAAYHFMFTNYKASTSERHIIARALRWGGTPWHPELQWFIDGLDLDKMEPRCFPLKEIDLGTFRVMTDEEVDVFFTKKEQAAEVRGVAKGLAEAKEATDGDGGS